jgi:colanic acid/amylovoran biosynthesis glycosyltransferase
VTHVAYVVSRWGEPTQTFVRREAEAIMASGVTVTAYSIKRPASNGGVPVTWLSPLEVARGTIRAVARHPIRTIRRLTRVLKASARHNALPQLAAACVGLAWSVRTEHPPDHLHCHFGWVSATATWVLGNALEVPYSVVLHAFELHTERLIDGFTRLPLDDAVAVFTISERDRQIVRERWSIPARVLRMGVPPEWTTPAVDRETNLIVSVGSLTAKKGHDALIRAFSRLPSTWRLTIAGEGPMRSELERLARALGLSERVDLVGHVDEDSVKALVARASIFALACIEAASGDRDGIPVAIMEAMALGTPVVTTEAGAIPELVEGAGVLVSPGRVDLLAAALSELAHDTERRVALGAAGQNRINEGWSSQRQAHEVLSVVRAREASS